MINIKKIFFSILISFCCISPLCNVSAQEETEALKVYLFWQQGCPHCAQEKVFLETLEEQRGEVEIVYYEIGSDSSVYRLMTEVKERLGVENSGVPLTVVGNNFLVGWYNEEVSGAALNNAIEFALENNSPDIIQEIINGDNSSENSNDSESISSYTMNLPVLGEVDIRHISLPLVTIVLGVLDGFNPCAMWVLMFLIMLLLKVEDSKRRWILGIVFILASSAVYFAFMVAWLNIILFLGVIEWIRFLIGALALIAGGYSFREYLVNPNSGCKVTGNEKRKKVFDNLRKIIQEKSFILAIGGMILLAFAVNLVELVCSLGLPVLYTQVLSMSSLSSWQYYGYILLYIFFFMLDDMVVFFIAMITLQMTGVTTKYNRYSRLVGGILMIIIGLLLIFSPETLMFA
ncbi:MAG: hypothetical protein WC178_04080 [Candidatus Paceibacterota bacterium]